MCVCVFRWVNPSDGVYGLDYGVELGKRAAAAGLDVVLNLHYSDTWTDAGTQTMPSEWASLSIDAVSVTPVVVAIYIHTDEVVVASFGSADVYAECA